MKETFALCTKNVHFTYIRKVFVQTDSVAMVSLLTPVLADIVMTDLEKTLLPDIYILYIKFWRKYIDDAISYVVMLSYLSLGNEVRQENWYKVSCLFNRNLFKGKLTHLEKVFFEKNNYPKYVIKLVFTQVKKEHKNRNYNNNMKNSNAVPITLENKNEKRHLLTIPYQSEKGDI